MSHHWRYGEIKDRKTRHIGQFAESLSDNAVTFSTAYDDAHAFIRLERYGRDGTIVFLGAKETVPGFNCEQVAVSFDDGPWRSFTCAELSDDWASLMQTGDSDVGSDGGDVVIGESDEFTALLRKASHLTIRVDERSAGRMQFTFSTKGLVWS